MKITTQNFTEKELLAQIAKAKMDLAVGKLKNVRQVFNLRKQVAVIKTKSKI